MNSFFGVLFGFLGWSVMGYLFSWLLLDFYDGGRFPMAEISEADKKSNSHLRIKYALGGGLFIGLFWFIAVHNNPLISN
jgi:hypothetical protein